MHTSGQATASSGHMPKEAAPKPNRWEGTHTYKKPETEKRRARTVAQLREEAAAKSKASREEAFNKRRGSICPPASPTAFSRRGSIGSISVDRTPAPQDTPDEGPPGREGNVTLDSDTSTSQPVNSMPNSGKKPRNKSGGGTPGASGSEDAGDGVDPALIRFLNAMKQDIVQSTKDAVSKIETRLEKNERGLERLEKKIEETDKSMSAKITAEVAKQCAGGSSAMVPLAAPVATTQNKRRDEAFYWCRRSLKLWPVTGEDLSDAVRVFLRTKLGLSDAGIEKLGSIEASLLPSKASREKKEVIATFESSDDRDFVKSNGSSLAGQTEAGMSLHVPGHLMDNLSALNGLAYSIKQKNRNVKRAVKFDDAKQDIYLDICIAGKWRRVTPKEAKQALKEVPSASLSESSLSVSDLTELIQGREVPGLTVAVVPEDGDEQMAD